MPNSSTTLTAEQALVEVGAAVRVETSLRSRTEGLTWIVWGLVSAATFLSFEAVGSLFYEDTPFSQNVPHGERVTPLWTGALRVPWLLIGILATYALWKSAALASPDPVPRPRHGLILLGWIGFVAAGWLLALLVLPGANVSTFPILGIGSAWILLGTLNLYRSTPLGRIVTTAIGSIIFIAGLLMAATISPHSAIDKWAAITGHLGAIITGLVPIAGGAWQTLRG